MDRAVRNLAQFAEWEFGAGSGCGEHNPARVAQIANKGVLAVGATRTSLS